MDAISIVGTAGSVANLLDELVLVIGIARDIAHRWKEANFIFMNLVSQLTALKAALEKIKEWAGSALNQSHYQLAMDLDVILTCCESLVERFNYHIKELRLDEQGSLSSASKFRIVSGAQKMEELQVFVSRQIGALNLLLDACNCETLHEQKTLLNQEDSRATLSRVEEDSVSLWVHRDRSSLRSSHSDTGSRLSLEFDFDRHLLGTRVYAAATKNLVKRVVKKERRTSTTINEAEQPATSTENYSMFVIGDYKSGKSTIVQQMKLLSQGVDDSSRYVKISFLNADDASDLSEYRQLVRRNLSSAVRARAEACEESGLQSRLEGLRIDDDDYLQNPDLLKSLEKDDCLRLALGSWPCYQDPERIESAQYFIENAARILANDFIPTAMDLLRCRVHTLGINKSTMAIGRLGFEVFDAGGTHASRKKWVHYLSSRVILFVVDLNCYDMFMGTYDELIYKHSLYPDSDETTGSLSLLDPSNKMKDSLLLFESIVNAKVTQDSIMFLVLNKADVFRDKLLRYPLSGVAPDYAGGDDTDSATTFIKDMYIATNKSNRTIHTFVTDATSATDIGRLCDAIEDVVRREKSFPNGRSQAQASTNTTALPTSPAHTRGPSGSSAETAQTPEPNGNEQELEGLLPSLKVSDLDWEVTVEKHLEGSTTTKTISQTWSQPSPTGLSSFF